MNMYLSFSIQTTASIKDERKLNVASFCSVFALIVQMLLYALIGSQGWVHVLALSIAAIPLLLSLPVWFKRNIALPITSYVTVMLVFISHFILFKENRQYLTEYLFQFVFMCLPTFINMSLKRDDKIEFKFLILFSFLIFAIGMIYSFLILMKIINWGSHSYNMSFSYYMLIPSLLFIHMSIKRKSLFYALVAILSFVSIVLLGSRAPIVFCFIFFVVDVFISCKTILVKIVWLFVFAALYFLFDSIVNSLQSAFASFGLTSRSLSYFVSGEFLSSGGRNEITSKSIDMILEKPVFGNGIGSDLASIGQYTHNLFLDIFLHYGLMVGGLIAIFICYLVLFAFFRSNNKSVFLIFFCAGFLPSLVSGTYLSSVFLWLFLGYCFRHLKINRVIGFKNSNTYHNIPVISR